MEIIKEDVFRKQLKKRLSGGYLFFGDEDYLKSFSLRAAKEAVCPDETFALFNQIDIDPLDYSAKALCDALMPPPMMAEQKLVTVDGLALSSLKAAELDELYEALSSLEDYDYNVLIISVPAGLIDEGNLPKKPSAILTELSKYLTPVHFETISGAKLLGWVRKHFEYCGVSADEVVCSELISRVGRSMFTLASETEKISYYVLSHGRSAVSCEDVYIVSPEVLDTTAYALANAILDGRYPDAMSALNVMKFNRVDPVIVLSEVSSVICHMVAIKALEVEGAQANEVAAILKMNEYKAKKYYTAIKGKSQNKIKRALELCSEADLAIKLSPQGYSAIERLICSL